MRQVFAHHFQLYPSMEPQDAVKLAYQSIYGGGHLISSPTATYDRLVKELALTSQIPGIPLFEPIGNGRTRMYLSSPAFSAYEPETVSFLFAEGAAPAVSSEGMDAPLALLRQLCEEGSAPFSVQALSAYLDGYEAQGRPAVRHSDGYRRAYHPAYRVMEKRLLRFLPLFKAIDDLLRQKQSVTVAIDGMSAAGKSSLGALLVKRYACNLIHMDDFFLPPELRTPQRFATPGGNIHHERFRQQVLEPLSAGKEFVYDVFDCHTMSFSEQVVVRNNRLTVIEGAYSLHPTLRDFYDLKVFLPVDPQQQLERIRLRNGEGCLPRFRDKWIPLENTYISACSVKECCNLILET